MIYFDTSALIKLFILEKGSEDAQRLSHDHVPVATATIAYPEMYSGFNRRKREGYLSGQQYTRLTRRFEEHWTTYIRIELTREILAVAKILLERHPLRAYDAIHLASAISLQKGTQEPLQFAAADSRLLNASSAEQLTPWRIGTT
ncbi:MAG: type II toxin-antitoxin system VapC family toxin [Nitrospira sp.]|nr:type II toxin-antitoxin system VapC family toxin [Nitrospira sp.]